MIPFSWSEVKNQKKQKDFKNKKPAQVNLSRLLFETNTSFYA